MTPRSFALVSLVATSLVAASASAEPTRALGSLRFGAPADETADTSARPPVEKAPASDFQLVGHAGIIGGTTGGLVLGGTGLARFGMFQVGGLAEAGGEVFAYEYVGVAATSGIGLRTASGFRFDALGVVGGHHYTHVGNELFSSDPGATGDLPFVGARMGVSYAFGSGPLHFDLGLWGLAEDDIGRTSQRYTYSEAGWFGAPATPKTVTHEIGAQRLGAALRLGVTFDR
jgi:hypothetical protein